MRLSKGDGRRKGRKEEGKGNSEFQFECQLNSFPTMLLNLSSVACGRISGSLGFVLKPYGFIMNPKYRILLSSSLSLFLRPKIFARVTINKKTPFIIAATGNLINVFTIFFFGGRGGNEILKEEQARKFFKSEESYFEESGVEKVIMSGRKLLRKFKTTHGSEIRFCFFCSSYRGRKEGVKGREEITDLTVLSRKIVFH